MLLLMRCAFVAEKESQFSSTHQAAVLFNACISHPLRFLTDKRWISSYITDAALVNEIKKIISCVLDNISYW